MLIVLRFINSYESIKLLLFCTGRLLFYSVMYFFMFSGAMVSLLSLLLVWFAKFISKGFITMGAFLWLPEIFEVVWTLLGWVPSKSKISWLLVNPKVWRGLSISSSDVLISHQGSFKMSRALGLRLGSF